MRRIGSRSCSVWLCAALAVLLRLDFSQPFSLPISSQLPRRQRDEPQEQQRRRHRQRQYTFSTTDEKGRRREIETILQLTKFEEENEQQQEQQQEKDASFLSFPNMLSQNEPNRRRELLVTSAMTTASWWITSTNQPAWAAMPGATAGRRNRRSSLYIVTAEKNASDAVPRDSLVNVEPYALSSELCLLKLLPVKNPLLRELEDCLEKNVAVLTTGARQDPQTWKYAAKAVEKSIAELDKRRGTLQPPFNPEDDDTILQIRKAERGEQLIENLRTTLERVLGATKAVNATLLLETEKAALLSLAEVGELLVAQYPYEVPTEGKFSYLPRLLGRAKVTFTIRRPEKGILGNVTIIADGYAAPITAGNFLDLALRKFYTGLPIKFNKKRLGSSGSSSDNQPPGISAGVGAGSGAPASDFEVANIPLLGSFQEGFYDPLTAKPRRIPLELVRVEKSTGVRNLAYSQGLSTLTKEQAVLEPTDNSKPILTFDIPGLVAFNHPDKNPNGGSSEFFALQKNSMMDEKRYLLNGEYAPFGFIVGGYDLFQKLQPNDIIEDTIVDEWGELNLVKLRRSSFSEAVQAADIEA